MKFIYMISIFIIISISTFSFCARYNLKNTSLNVAKSEKSSDVIMVQEYQEYFWTQKIDSSTDPIRFLLKTHRQFKRRFIIVNAETISFTESADKKNIIKSKKIIYKYNKFIIKVKSF